MRKHLSAVTVVDTVVKNNYMKFSIISLILILFILFIRGEWVVNRFEKKCDQKFLESKLDYQLKGRDFEVFTARVSSGISSWEGPCGCSPTPDDNPK